MELMHLSDFYEHYCYGKYVLVNELYEDYDVRKNGWMWGEREGNYVKNPVWLKGLSSNSYASFEEVWNIFKKTVDSVEETV